MPMLTGTFMRLLFLAMVALIALVTGSQAATFPAPDGNCPPAEQDAGLCTTQRGFVIEPHAVYPRIEDIGGIPHKIYTVRVTPKGSAGGCTNTANRFAVTFESPVVPGSCQPQPQPSMWGCTGGCTVELTTGLGGQSGVGDMAASLRSIDVVKFAKSLSCSAAPIDITMVFRSTDTIEQTLDADIADFAVVAGSTGVGMIPGPFCVPTKPELNIISTKYSIEGHGEFQIFLDTAGGVVKVLDVNGLEVSGIDVTETYTCTPAAGRCPTTDPASFCTTAGATELLCENVQAVVGDLTVKAGAESTCYRTMGGKVYKVC